MVPTILPIHTTGSATACSNQKMILGRRSSAKSIHLPEFMIDLRSVARTYLPPDWVPNCRRKEGVACSEPKDPVSLSRKSAKVPGPIADWKLTSRR